MLGDFLRAAGELIAVLYPLETIVSVQFSPSQSIDWGYIVLAEVIAGTLLWWGIILEGRENE